MASRTVSAVFSDALRKASIKAGDRVLLAVSGGLDSMVMASLFQASGTFLMLAHVNYGLRSHEADLDEQLVKEYGLKHGIPVSVLDAKKLIRVRNGASVQMKAREIRYCFFRDLMVQHELHWLATAHHQDDQIEHFFLALMRGGGLRSLSGMPLVKGQTVRPLLELGKVDLLQYAREHSIPWREDSSNRKSTYRRNRIRNRFLPIARNLVPEVIQNLPQTCIRLKMEQNLLSHFMENYRNHWLQPVSEGYYVPHEAFANLPDPAFGLFEILRPLEISYTICREAAQNLTSGARIFISGSWMLRSERHGIRVSKEFDQRSVLSHAALLIEEVASMPSELGQVTQNEAYIDADKVSESLVLRTWEKGDFFYPVGMKGRKLLSNYFTDRKFEQREKEAQLILVSGPSIVWLVNQRVDARFAATGSSKNILRVLVLLPRKG